jgi:hypothetical protein
LTVASGVVDAPLRHREARTGNERWVLSMRRYGTVRREPGTSVAPCS